MNRTEDVWTKHERCELERIRKETQDVIDVVKEVVGKDVAGIISTYVIDQTPKLFNLEDAIGAPCPICNIIESMSFL